MGSIKTTIYLFSLLLLLALVVLSCTKKDISVDAAPNFLFGTSYGECVGNCDHYFAVKNGSVYPTSGKYFPGPVVIGNTALPAEKYEQAQRLIQKLPAYLLEHKDQTFGCPDCHDQGGLHIEYSAGDDVIKWHIDTDTTAIPSEIRSYSWEVINTVSQLEKY